MKNWEQASIVELKIKETEHQWSFQWSLDGGYLGDGKISGWFGKDNSNSNTNHCGLS